MYSISHSEIEPNRYCVYDIFYPVAAPQGDMGAFSGNMFSCPLSLPPPPGKNNIICVKMSPSLSILIFDFDRSLFTYLPIGGMAVVAFWRSPHRPLGSARFPGPPRAGYSQRRKRKIGGERAALIFLPRPVCVEYLVM